MNTATIDRVSPTRRPEAAAVSYQQWRQLLFLHWPVDADRAAALIPQGLELDTFDGQAYVGLVPFQMQRVQPWPWWPASLGFRFPETNVRLYVLRGGEPGVLFLSLDAASALAVRAARMLWGLPYFHARMDVSRQDDGLVYECRRGPDGPRSNVACRVGEALPDSPPDSPEFFFLERYLLFVQRRGRIWRGQVHHTPYPVQAVGVERCEDQLVEAAGLGPIDDPPAFAHYSPGVDVEVFRLAPA